MRHICPVKLVVLIACLLLITSYALPATTISAERPVGEEWIAEPMHISEYVEPFAVSGYTPNQTKTAYRLPTSGGTGTTIAIIIAYHTPNIRDYLIEFSEQFELPLPIDNSTFEVHQMASTIAVDSEWSMEACLDVQWAHAIAPEAKILLVEAENNTSTALLQAVEWATNQPDVVSISMSWGAAEQWWGPLVDDYFEVPGITFFASTGDDGAEVNWPAVSPYVIAVGGTTLNLYANGSVISETGWSGSGGGISAFESRPSYQTAYGLTGSKRTVPDVSYNANPATGFPVYDGTWHKVGGTSAGAPQWAAIYALGVSATNANLYQKAKAAYTSYFRDITSGNNGYSATVGYDYVTGLGSPLTMDFGTDFTVSPTQGPAGGSITLSGVGFTAGSSVNISYLNPLNSSWIPIINDLATSSENFTYQASAPDLIQNNPAGDNQPLSNSIIFRAVDNSTGQAYNTTVPYTEWRRGLTQLVNVTAVGLYGNNSDLSTAAFVQNGQAFTVAGRWFSSGNVSLLWDDVNIGETMIDSAGSFSANVIAPTATAGQHTLTIRDNATSFCVNLTRLPSIANDYVDVWHTADFPINLTPDYALNETFYRINSGDVQNVTANWQPTITIEGNNTLEYWGTWDLYGTGNSELPHQTLTGVKLDKTAPIGTITTDPLTTTANIVLALSASDSASGVAQMRFSDDYTPWTEWETYATSKAWSLQGGNGQKTVTVEYRDIAGLISTSSCSVTLQTPLPTSSPAATSPPNPPPTPTATPTTQPTTQPSPTPSVPELNLAVILVLLALSTLMVALVSVKRRK